MDRRRTVTAAADKLRGPSHPKTRLPRRVFFCPGGTVQWLRAWMLSGSLSTRFLAVHHMDPFSGSRNEPAYRSFTDHCSTEHLTAGTIRRRL